MKLGTAKKKKTIKKKKITLLNPPIRRTVKNVGNFLLTLLNKHFPIQLRPQKRDFSF